MDDYGSPGTSTEALDPASQGGSVITDTSANHIHPIDLSTRMIDSGVVETAPNRVTQSLSELGDDVALIESFSHVVILRTADGLVLFDSSSSRTGPAVVESLRRWSDEPVNTIVYTHGHLDHVGGSGAFAADADRRGHPRPRVLGHANLNRRLDRYQATSGYNQVINRRQFGGAPISASTDEAPVERPPFVPPETLRVDLEYETSHTVTIGDMQLDLHHARGETDDHTWTWIPELKAISAGDQFIWNFPNCGNPQKVQRYPAEWAESLRAMAAKEPELFIPAHGLPIAGTARIVSCLDVVASTLETLVSEVVAAMNTGATLDTIVSEVSVDPDVLALPFLRPLYDEPEFVIRNIWRLYGGWWDGNPARLKPAPDSAIGTEVARLSGGVEKLVERATELSAAGDHRLACQLIEFAAAAAEPEATTGAEATGAVHEARSMIYLARREAESSLMSKGIFASAAAESDLARGVDVELRSPNLGLDG